MSEEAGIYALVRRGLDEDGVPMGGAQVLLPGEGRAHYLGPFPLRGAADWVDMVYPGCHQVFLHQLKAEVARRRIGAAIAP